MDHLQVAAAEIRYALQLPANAPGPAVLVSFLLSIQLGGPRVSSSHNLLNFERWIESATREEFLIAMYAVFIVEHVPAHGDMGQPISISRPDIGLEHISIQRIECGDGNCHRCRSGRGGYHFRFIGPWTCQSTIASPEMTPLELQAAVDACQCSVCRHTE